MKLYIISQKEARGYDTFSSAIVCAESPEQAKTIHPRGDIYNDDMYLYDKDNRWLRYSSREWASKPDNVGVEYIGEATDTVKFGIVLASFHAG